MKRYVLPYFAVVLVIFTIVTTLATLHFNDYDQTPIDINDTIATSNIQLTTDKQLVWFEDECITLNWYTEDIQSIFIDEVGVAGEGSRQFCSHVFPISVSVNLSSDELVTYVIPIDVVSHDLIFWIATVVLGFLLSALLVVLGSYRLKDEDTLLIFVLATHISMLFILWSSVYIYRSSFVAFTGERYFALFDDAVISLRYAWNFANGNGLVWSVGDPVEGYTNFLMTLYMSVVSWLIPEQRFATLAIQISGIATILAIASVALLITRRLVHALSLPRIPQIIAPALVFLGVCTYYPLVFWTIMGMETGLWTLLIIVMLWFVLRYQEKKSLNNLVYVGIFLAAANMTRPETIVVIIVVLIYLYLQLYIETKNLLGSLKPLILPVIIVGLASASHTVFRLLYYGDIVPNTYHLKATGLSLYTRAQTGIQFLAPFVDDSLWLILLATLSAVILRKRELILFSFLFGLFFLIQIYVGGDAWPYWRMTAPFMPLLLISAVVGISSVLTRILTTLDKYNNTADYDETMTMVSAVAVLVFVFGLGFWHTSFRFFDEYSFKSPPYNTQARQQQVDTALALRAVVDREATIAVTWGGLPLYYSQIYHGIDILGKSDTTIATLDYVWSTRPGHNKYDLTYSIVELEPDYIATCSLTIDLCPQLATDYVRVIYEGITLHVRRDSPHVNWELVTIVDEAGQ